MRLSWRFRFGRLLRLGSGEGSCLVMLTKTILVERMEADFTKILVTLNARHGGWLIGAFDAEILDRR
jgi:hypothetical protein